MSAFVTHSLLPSRVSTPSMCASVYACVCSCKLWDIMMGLCECEQSLSAKVFLCWNHIPLLLNAVLSLLPAPISAALLSPFLSFLPPTNLQRSTIGNSASRRWRTSCAASLRTTTRSSNMSSATWTSEWLRRPLTCVLTAPPVPPVRASRCNVTVKRLVTEQSYSGWVTVGLRQVFFFRVW